MRYIKHFKIFFIIQVVLTLINWNSAHAASPRMTKLEVATVLDSVGFPPPLVPIMTCIAEKESSFRTTILNRNTNRTTDFGVMQINSIWLTACHATEQSILDVYKNMQCAHLIYYQQGLTAWVTFNKFRDICLKYKVESFKLPNSKKMYTVINESEIL